MTIGWRRSALYGCCGFAAMVAVACQAAPSAPGSDSAGSLSRTIDASGPSAHHDDYMSREMNEMAREDAQATRVRPPDQQAPPPRRPVEPLDRQNRSPVDQPRIR